MSPAKPPTRAAQARKKKAARRRWMWSLLLIPAVIFGAGGLLAFYLIFAAIPLPDDVASDASVVYDHTGTPVGTLAEERSRSDLSLAELPAHVPASVLAAEDRRFYEHRGISATGILRAVFTNVRAGSVRQGGSTITQQYIKNALLTPDQSYARKVEEAALAVKLERRYDKDTILTFYLNTIYWGRGAYGIEAAARTYFGISATELDVNQAATLAGIIAAPEAYDPAEQPERADTRRRYVLGGMVETGALDAAESSRLVAAGLPDVNPRAGLDRGPNAYYLDAVRRELSAVVTFQDGQLFRGLKIFTGLDPMMQEAAQDTLRDAVANGPSDTGAIVSIDPFSGEVRALVGGPDGTAQPLNTALRSVRQAGSTFKTFALQAFLEAGFHPDSVFPAPGQLAVGDATIRNYGGSETFAQTVGEATARSTNTVYVQMQDEAGRERVIDAARRSGLPLTKRYEPFPTDRSEGDTMRPFAGLTLGQDVFSPLEVTASYQTFAADGFRRTPRLVVRVEDAQGRVLYEPDVRDEQAVSVAVARSVTGLLQRAVSGGTGRAASLDGRPVAGKTGTTNDARDVWFVGYIPQLVTGVWLGNLDNTPLGGSATGGGLAAPVWAAYMNRAVSGFAVESFPAPQHSGTVIGRLTSCPDDYQFVAVSALEQMEGEPDVLDGYLNADGEICAQMPPPECPEGYTFTATPDGGFPDGTDVLDTPVDDTGRVCVRQTDTDDDDGADAINDAPQGDDDADGAPTPPGDTAPPESTS